MVPADVAVFVVDDDDDDAAVFRLLICAMISMFPYLSE